MYTCSFINDSIWLSIKVPCSEVYKKCLACVAIKGTGDCSLYVGMFRYVVQ